MSHAEANRADEPVSAGEDTPLVRWFLSTLERPRLGLLLAVLAVLLSSPALSLDFYLDDFVGRYVYSSELPGAARLRDVLSGGYGIANGVPADTHWQIEKGFAPWWTDEHLLGALMRPLSMLGHFLDVHFWPDSAPLQRAHSLAWLALLVVLVTQLYRGVLGVRLGGFAALLFAIDHTHGFCVGYITNRHVLIGAAFAVACLHLHVRTRDPHRALPAVAPVVLYALGLLSSEATLSITAYLFGYAAFVERGPLGRRALSLLPYFLVTVVWHGVYTSLGYGMRGSGLYLDPTREPVRFVAALAERAPVLLNGFFMGPPAEAYTVLAPEWRGPLLALSLGVVALAAFAFGGLLKGKRRARMWAVGMLFSLVPAGATYPHNRQLLFASIGGIGLLAELWHYYVFDLRGQVRGALSTLAERVGALFVGVHLFLSPLLLPLSTCSPALLMPLHRALVTVGDEVAGREAVFLTSPDYFAVKLVVLSRIIEGKEPPSRVRALSFGPVGVTVERTEDRVLTLTYEGGILNTPFLELYRDRRNAMAPGHTVDLLGHRIEVLEVTEDGRASRVRFAFDHSLADAGFRFYIWGDDGYEPWRPPAVGGSVKLPAAVLRYGLQ